MDRVRLLLKPGTNGHLIATEALYTMMKDGAEGTSTPIRINSGIRSCWTHGRVDRRQIMPGGLVVAGLTPRFEGYCANLARTFVLGNPSRQQLLLLDTYREIHEAARQRLKPGVTIAELDGVGAGICARRQLEKYHLNGISHGIGLRFEETPASTIIPAHRKTKLKPDMTVTVGHTILAIPGVGGVRFEDVCRVTPEGGQALHEYPIASPAG